MRSLLTLNATKVDPSKVLLRSVNNKKAFVRNSTGINSNRLSSICTSQQNLIRCFLVCPQQGTSSFIKQSWNKNVYDSYRCSSFASIKTSDTDSSLSQEQIDKLANDADTMEEFEKVRSNT